MNNNIPEIEELIKNFSKLPGLGPKSAKRIILKLINNKENMIKPLAKLLANVYKNVTRCNDCGNLKITTQKCICETETNNYDKICVVENLSDMWVIESANIYKGHFHILGGTLNSDEKYEKKNLLIDSLIKRVKKNNLKEIEITGLSKKGVSATLTATCRRSTIKSKTKSIKRCEQLVVNKSKFSGAGIGSTTFDNGLTFNDTFGYRVEDEVIALGFAEGSRILGIFESNDNTDPDIPSVTVSSQSDSFTGNVIAGEQFIGAESGAVARVVTVSSSAKLDFVYENDRRFTIDESFTCNALSGSSPIPTLPANLFFTADPT